MRKYTIIVAILTGVFLLTGCGGNDGPDDAAELPTRFMLPSLSADDAAELPTLLVLPSPSADAAASITESPAMLTEEATGETIGALIATPTENAINVTTPEPTPASSIPDIPAPTQEPMFSGTGEEVVQDFSTLQIGDVVFLGGVIVLDVTGNLVFLQDPDGNQVYIGTSAEVSGVNPGEFVTMSGQMEGLSNDDILTLNINISPEISLATRQAEEFAPQLIAVDVTLSAGLTALQAYDGLLSSIEDDYLDGHELVAIFGSSFAGWTFEFYRLSDAEAYHFTVDADGTTTGQFFRRMSTQPDIQILPIDRTMIQVDSDTVYDRLDLTDVPDFATPELRLSASEPGAIIWQVFTAPAQIFDATGATSR